MTSRVIFVNNPSMKHYTSNVAESCRYGAKCLEP
jgi:hypothetical protein